MSNFRCGGSCFCFPYPICGVFPINDRSEQSISSLGNRLNVVRIFSVVAKSLPQFANRHSKAAVKVAKRISLPDTTLDILPRNHLPGILKKNYEQPERLLLDPHALTSLKELARSRVGFEEAKFVRGPNRRFHSANLNNRGPQRLSRFSPVYASPDFSCCQRVAS